MTKFSDYETDYTTYSHIQSPYENFMEVMDAINQVKAVMVLKRKMAECCTDPVRKRELERFAESLKQRREAIIRKVESDYFDCNRNVENWFRGNPLILKNPITGKVYSGNQLSERKELYMFLSLEKTLYGKGFIHPRDLQELGNICGTGAFPYKAFAEIYSDLENRKNR